MSSSPAAVVIPGLCGKHEVRVLQRLGMTSDEDPWQLALDCAKVLLFQWVTLDPRVVARTARDVANLNHVLGEIGCLACFDHAGYGRAVRVMKKGLEHAVNVGRLLELDDDWPIKAREGQVIERCGRAGCGHVPSTHLVFDRPAPCTVAGCECPGWTDPADEATPP